jgi:hypothetical protein
MTWRCCCLCDAAREFRRGEIRENERVPLCAGHRAELRWKRREPLPPITDPLLEMIGRTAMLAS